MILRALKLTCFALLLAGLSGCGLGYVTRGAFQGIKLLSARQPLTQVIEDSKTPPQLRKRLELAKAVLKFSETIGLNPNGAYSSFVQVDSAALSWILMVSKQDSFELKTWWFPIVGTVPYKGYFSKEDAVNAGKLLRAEGYEGLVRPTAAFSSLGWFKDPILSTITDGDEVNLINTLIHELVHRHIWIKNDAIANESLANFVGTEATIDFLESSIGSPPSNWTTAEILDLLARAKRSRDAMYKLAGALNSLYSALDRVYKSSLSAAEKLELREVVFNGVSEGDRAILRKAGGFEKINNAEIMQHRIYHVGLNELKATLKIHRRSWHDFLGDYKN